MCEKNDRAFAGRPGRRNALSLPKKRGLCQEAPQPNPNANRVVSRESVFSNMWNWTLQVGRGGGLLVLAIVLGCSNAVANTLEVPNDFATIQAAIDAANDGDTILVGPGTYVGNLMISGKSLTLASHFSTTSNHQWIGETVLDGGGAGAVLRIEGDSGTEVTFTGFTLRNASDGILGAARATITHNIFEDLSDAIDYQEGGGGVCRYNRFHDNRDDAIDLDESVAVDIEFNWIQDSGDDGIEIRLHDYTGPLLNIIIRDNRILNNGEDGIQLIDGDFKSDRLFRIERNLIAGNAKVGIGLMGNMNSLENFEGAPLEETILVFNNTIADNPCAVTGGRNLVAVNNLFVGSENVALKNIIGNSVIAHNGFWGNSVNSENSNYDPALAVLMDPKLDAHWKLTAESPAIDAGVAAFEWQGTMVLDKAADSFAGVAPDLGNHERSLIAPPRLRIESGLDPFMLSWESRSGGFYQMEQSTDLVEWTSMGSPLVGDDRVWRIAFPLDSELAFYRLGLR